MRKNDTNYNRANWNVSSHAADNLTSSDREEANLLQTAIVRAINTNHKREPCRRLLGTQSQRS